MCSYLSAHNKGQWCSGAWRCYSALSYWISVRKIIFTHWGKNLGLHNLARGLPVKPQLKEVVFSAISLRNKTAGKPTRQRKVVPQAKGRAQAVSLAPTQRNGRYSHQLWCPADLSLQTDAVLEQACASSRQAHLPFLVPDTPTARWCWAATGHEQLLSKHCGVICRDKICQGEKLFPTRQTPAASSLVLLPHPVQEIDGTFWVRQLLYGLFCHYLSGVMDRTKTDCVVWLRLCLLYAVQPRPRSLQVL